MVAFVTGGKLPNRTLTFIAQLVGVTHERVRQRAERLNLSSYHDQQEELKKTPISCKGCKKMFLPKNLRMLFHSPECQAEYRKTHLAKRWYVCPMCGKSFYTQDIAHTRRFCSRKCHGVWFGEKNNLWRDRVAQMPNQFTAKEYHDKFNIGYTVVSVQLKSAISHGILKILNPENWKYIYQKV